MIQKVEMYTVVCDNCGIDSAANSEFSCWNDKDYAEDVASESDWLKDGEKHYCPKCYSYDEDGNVVITKLSVRGNVLVDQSDKCDGECGETKQS